MSTGNANGRKQRLELTWIGKDERPRLEPRILLPVAEQSHRAASDGGIHDNILIHGDNLLALKALEQEFSGKVKCIYIDPPYNTGSAFEHYDDGLEHSLWLSLIRDRIEILWRLLDADEGSLWVSIDDREMGYLRLMLDEICGRTSFIACNVWQKRYSRENREAIGDAHEYIFTYARNPHAFKTKRNLIPLGETQRRRYANPNHDKRGAWQSVSLLAQGFRPNQMYEITGPSGRVHTPPPGNCWKIIRAEFDKLIAESRVYFGANGDGVPRRMHFLTEAEGLVPWTWWPHDDVGHTGEAKNEANLLFGADVSFGTPKPERLMKRVIEIATNPGDLVLDSFAGSGTTGAVAHKMGRRWIMVELGDHAHTHIVPRLKKVIDGQDAGGITEAVGWKGGGGFRAFRLAPSLIEEDQFGQKVISKDYNAAMLSEAMCKHMGFTYAPSQKPEEYWRHGHSSERDFIYTTTQSLTYDALKALSHEVGDGRTLLICCKAFRAKVQDFPNLTVKKIPQAVLANCEWGRDDYSLTIAKPPEDAQDEPDDDAGSDDGTGGESVPRRRGHPRRATEPEVEVQAAPARKAPLKMDGTTRAPKPTRPAALAPVAVPAHPAAVKPAAASTQPSKAPAKRGRPPKPKDDGSAKTAPKATTDKSAAKVKPSPKAKSRRAADDRQGRLL